MVKRKKTKPANRKQSRQTSSRFLANILLFTILIIALLGIMIYIFVKRLPSSKPITKPPKEEYPVTFAPRYDCLPVYFFDSTAQFLVPVHLPVTDDAMFLDVRARKVIEQLIAGPPTNALLGVMPPGTNLNSVKVDSDLAIVDLSEDVLSYGGGSTYENGIVNSIRYSLTELPKITKVQILIDGKKKEYLPEGTPIDQPLERDVPPNSDISIGEEGRPKGYFFYLERSRQLLVPVLSTWEGDSDSPLAKLSALYSKPTEPLSESLISPAPEGIRILTCEIKQDTLTLVLDHDNFANVFKEFNARTFLEATYLTLCDLRQFSKAEITVGTGQEAVPLWSYAAFSELENMKIPPFCYNQIRSNVQTMN